MSFYARIQESIKDDKPIRWDDSDSSNVYIGYAKAGTSESAENWVVEKITDTGKYISTGAWDNRIALTYV